MGDDALQAIRAGDVDRYVAVIQDRAAAVTARLPQPTGRPWSDDDIEDLVSEFYVSKAYQHAVINAHDDDSLRGLVYTGLANLVRSELRRTNRGRLHRRVRELLGSEGFVEVDLVPERPVDRRGSTWVPERADPIDIGARLSPTALASARV